MIQKTAGEVLQSIIDGCFVPNAGVLAGIIVRGEIAVVVYNLDETDALVQRAVKALGWDGTSPVFPLAARLRRTLIEESEQRADPVTARWLRGGSTGRIFLWTGRRTLLINYEPGDGYSLESGSLDASRPEP